ncbi:MAG TPA: hypothetical protein VJ869_06530 [Sphaerochaeta sp.]|nr:hypothetical protein [Sphaerochaeta sp.]
MLKKDYHKNVKRLMEEAREKGVLKEWMRFMCRNDIFFLLVYVLGRTDLDHYVRRDGSIHERDWLYDRCNEVQANPDGYLDIWARDHYKSTIITWAKTIQDILIDPEITICIYAYSSTLAKKFLKQIKHTLESNNMLIELFDDILFDDVGKPSWKTPEGETKQMVWGMEAICVKRKSTAKEQTVEASGLVIGQRTGGHYNLLVYDDVVTPDSVTTSDMIHKTTAQFEMSLNTGSSGDRRIRIIGTFYHYNDTYNEIIKKGYAKPRVYPCIDSDGKGVLYDQAELQFKRKAMSTAIFASQMLCDPKAHSSKAFLPEWIQYYERTKISEKLVYILVDPADSKKKRSDYTTMWVIGFGEDRNYYILDIIRDKMKLTERTDALFSLMRKYTNNNIKPPVFYEKISMQSDIQHIEYVQEIQDYRFQITEVSSYASKDQRIGALEPLFREHRIWFPRGHMRRNWKFEEENMVETFIKQEFEMYPLASHDDALDCLAWIAQDKVSQKMVFPDPIMIQDRVRMQLEGKGIKFNDVEDAVYSPL